MNNDEKQEHEIQASGCFQEGGDNIDKTARYTGEDWARIQAKANNIYKKLVNVMDKGAADPAVQKLIDELRQHITDDVCCCTPEILKQIGNIYAFDKRFTAKVDNCRAGFAAFLRDAIYIYCDSLTDATGELPEK